MESKESKKRKIQDVEQDITPTPSKRQKTVKSKTQAEILQEIDSSPPEKRIMSIIDDIYSFPFDGKKWDRFAITESLFNTIDDLDDVYAIHEYKQMTWSDFDSPYLNFDEQETFRLIFMVLVNPNLSRSQIESIFIQGTEDFNAFHWLDLLKHMLSPKNVKSGYLVSENVNLLQSLAKDYVKENLEEVQALGPEFIEELQSYIELDVK